MMSKMILRLCTIVMLLSLTGCISEYYANIESTTNLLVVEGTITQGMTKIKLSKSVDLNAYEMNPRMIDNAKVSVECDNGTLYPADAHVEKGTYTIRIEELNQQARYRLLISLEGKEYESSFLEPMETPPIESVSFLKEARDFPIYIDISTQNNDKSKYYKWSYEEIWETKGEFFAFVFFDEDGSLVWYDEEKGPFNMGYYCWTYGRPDSLLLKSVDKLSSGLIRNNLLKIDYWNDRFSELYYIKVQQNVIRKEAYDYFANIKNNAENSGDVFAPIPLELKGNIHCLTDPEIPVIGYVEVSNTAWKEAWVPWPNNFYQNPVSICDPTGKESSDVLKRDYAPRFAVWERNNWKIYYKRKDCLDCRLRRKGSKNKPDFWPNDHR